MVEKEKSEKEIQATYFVKREMRRKCTEKERKI